MKKKEQGRKFNDSFSALLSFIAEPVIAIKSSGQVVAANQVTEKYTGIRTDDLIGKDLLVQQIFDENSATIIREKLRMHSGDVQIAPYKVTMKGKNGKVTIFEVNFTRIENYDEIIGILVFEEITEEIQNNKQILNQFRSKSEFKNLSNLTFDGIVLIADSVKEALILIDEEARIIYWNRASEKTFGYTKKEAIGRIIHELVVPISMCPEAKERIEQSVKVFSETGLGYFSVGNVELIGRRKDGSEFPAELSVSPVRFNGKWNAIGVVKDITKRKQADQKLREAEQRYHTLFNQAPIGVLVLDPETASFVEFNEVAHVQLGYNREEFEILTIFDIEDKESPQETRAHLKEIIENGGDEFGTLQRTKRGEARNVIVTARSFQSAGRTFIHCIFHDITEIVKVQNALAKSEAQYRQLVELAHEGIWAIDNDFTTIFVNPRMAQMLGYTCSELLGKSIFDFFGAGKVNTIKEFARKFDPERMSNSFEYAFLLKNGRRLDTSISLSIIADDQKQKVGLLAVVSDITQRKQVEKALKESGEISRAIVANAPIGIATSDKSYHFVTANEAFCKILGYTQAELRKLTFKDLTHPEDCAKSIENMTALEKGEVTSFQDEKRYFKKDGSIIDGKLIINAIRDSKGEPTLFVVQLEDVTKRKQLENDLRTSEERFRAMSTSAMDSIVLCDSEDIVLYWNPAAEKTFGYPANEVIGKKLADAVIPKTLHQNHARFVGGLSRNAPKRQFGLTALRKDGSRFPIDLSMTLVKLNGQDCFLSTIRDITEWKAMEEKIRRERDLLESVTASTDILLSIVGRDYRIIWANHKAKQTFHGSNIEGRHCYEIFADDPQNNCRGCGVKKVFENNESIVRRDYHRKTKEGRNFWAELISTPIKDKDGNVFAALELAIDITERKHLQNKLAEYSQKLEELVQKRTDQLKQAQAELVKSERLAAIGELAGMIGHDLRNPLTGIKNSTYFMKKKGTELPPNQTEEMLEIIDRCVDYSNRIINDLLDYSRELHLALEEQSPKKLLNDSLLILNIPDKIRIINNLDEASVFKVDPSKMKRVFINLVKNAVDAMPDGGKITVESQKVKEGLEISLSDTGAGISEEILPKLFIPLITTKSQGMGFGLAICKRIVEAHGGTISVRTAKGEGTTFTIIIPFKPILQAEVKSYG